MRAAVPILIAASALMSLAACENKTQGDTVRAVYDNKADAIEQAAAVQPTAIARKIYKARADALREEGKDRETGIEGGTPSKGEGGGMTAGGTGSAPTAPPQ